MHFDTPLLWPWRAIPISAVPPEWVANPAFSIGIEVAVAIPFFWMIWKWVGK